MNSFIKKISFFIFILVTSCSAQEEKQDYLEVTYSAETRGNRLQISYSNHTIIYKNKALEKTIILKAEEIQLIYELISKIDLPEIKNLKSPSNQSFSDAAMSASFEIKSKKETFISSNFDHENPPEELNLLYKTLKKIIQ